MKFPPRRVIWLALAAAVLLAILVVDLVILLDAPRPPTDTHTASAPSAPPPATPTPAASRVTETELPPVVRSETGAPFAEPLIESPPRPPPLDRNATVRQAALRSCSTSSVDGLSRQIIAEMRRIAPTAFERVPARPNLVTDENVFLYLHASARDRLLAVLDGNKTRTMKINSALRTVAQQYLVAKWGAAKRCGVQLAALPGESNHESGLALDVAEPATWRAQLEAHGFRWMGKSDVVHFDFEGKRGGRPAPPGAAQDIKAFQRLWNRHHPDDRIDTNGLYDAATARRLEKAPAAGWPVTK